MEISKVEFLDRTLIDLTGDTVVPNKLAYGYTAHDKSGELIVGTNKAIPLDPLEYDYNVGYVMRGTWTWEYPTLVYNDIYEIENGVTYFLTLGGNVGTRFRAMTTDVDIRTITSAGKVTGTQVVELNNPAAYRNVTFTSTIDGYLIVGKDNAGVSGLFTYLYKSLNWD